MVTPCNGRLKGVSANPSPAWANLNAHSQRRKELRDLLELGHSKARQNQTEGKGLSDYEMKKTMSNIIINRNKKSHEGVRKAGKKTSSAYLACIMHGKLLQTPAGLALSCSYRTGDNGVN